MNKYKCAITATVIAEALLLSACSTDLGPETLPSTTPPTEATETIVETTEETVRPETTEPASTAVVTEHIVEKYGALAIDGSKIVNSEGEQVVLNGISSYGIQFCEEFFTADTVKTLAEDWGCDVLRIAVSGDEVSGGYLTDSDKYFDTVCKICDMCIEQGIYVIVDWNVCYLNENDENKEEAIDFFTRISNIYPDSPNIIYEVANEAVLHEESEEEVSEWEDIIKPFVTEVINAIRTNNPESLIIVDAPNNGKDIVTVSESKLDYKNLAYGYRFFAGSTGDADRDKAQKAIDSGMCVFATWGLSNDKGMGGVSVKKADKWIEFFSKNQVSWCNYAIGSNSADDFNALRLDAEYYTDEQKASHWPDGLLSESGHYIREQLLKTTETADTTETTESTEPTEE